MNTILEELKNYFRNTPQEQILKDWAETEKYDQVGPTIYEFKVTQKYMLDNGICDPLGDFENFYTFTNPKIPFGFSFSIN